MLGVKRREFIALIGGAAAWPLAAAFLAAGISVTGPASAQTYPSRPITLVVPYPPGGATDAIARIIQDSMSQSLGQQIVIENIGGAGGMIAAGRAARAAPDGYTVLLHQVALAAGMTLYPNLAFDAEKDFVPIGLINTAASTLAARPTLPPNDIAELVRWMKTPGQNVKIAHPGVGSFGHLAGVLVAEEIGATVTHVPYRGGGPRPPGQGRQNQGLRHHRQNPLRRPAGAADHGRGRLQEARSRFLAHAARARRHAAADRRAGQRRAAPRARRWEGPQNLRRRRHGRVSTRSADAGSRGRAAQARAQALGRGDPRQQHRGAVVQPARRE